MEIKEFCIVVHGKEETQKIGEMLAHGLKPGDVITLEGDLGAGKTTFVSGVAKGLGIKENVLSPTFNIMKCYFEGKLTLYHIDAYRLEDQMIDIGLDEAIEGDGATFIEWPKFIAPLIPQDHLSISFHIESPDKRTLSFSYAGKKSYELWKKLKEKYYA